MTPAELAKEVMEDLILRQSSEPIVVELRSKFHSWAFTKLFVGGENMHGRYEFVSLQTMEKPMLFWNCQ